MVVVVVSRAWAQHGRTTFETDAGRLPDVLRQLADAEPEYRRRLLNSDGEPYGYLSIFVDAESVPRNSRAEIEVADGSTVTIVPPLVGG
ncbi:MAG TPA: MoaD/ThiS family protein [Jatrophihabitans sp.]|nr:MoaD/ThiS family protein [Jatrophihabitans sp.]